MPKISELTNIEDRTPLIMYIDKDYDEIEVLHIVRRNGLADGRFGKYRENITNCNRVMKSASVFGYETIHINGFKLCARCGTHEDFQQALNEYRQERERYNQERQEKERAEEESRRKAWGELKAAVNEFDTVLAAKGIVTQPSEHGHELTIERGDYIFTISARRK